MTVENALNLMIVPIDPDDAVTDAGETRGADAPDVSHAEHGDSWLRIRFHSFYQEILSGKYTEIKSS
jgi:hypothetical protein